MKIKSGTYEVGYGRPPKQTRWRKGQSGNPTIRKRLPKPVVEMIDEFFVDEIKIVEKGISRRVTNFEVIVLQLWNKVMAGNKRAMKVLLQYKEFAASRGGMPGVEVIQGRTEHLIPEDGDENE